MKAVKMVMLVAVVGLLAGSANAEPWTFNWGTDYNPTNFAALPDYSEVFTGDWMQESGVGGYYWNYGHYQNDYSSSMSNSAAGFASVGANSIISMRMKFYAESESGLGAGIGHSEDQASRMITGARQIGDSPSFFKSTVGVYFGMREGKAFALFSGFDFEGYDFQDRFPYTESTQVLAQGIMAQWFDLELAFDTSSGSYMLMQHNEDESLSLLLAGAVGPLKDGSEYSMMDRVFFSDKAYESYPVLRNDGLGETFTVSVTDVPEPATLSLLAIGGVCALIRRKKKALAS